MRDSLIFHATRSLPVRAPMASATRRSQKPSPMWGARSGGFVLEQSHECGLRISNVDFCLRTFKRVWVFGHASTSKEKETRADRCPEILWTFFHYSYIPSERPIYRRGHHRSLPQRLHTRIFVQACDTCQWPWRGPPRPNSRDLLENPGLFLD